MVFTRSVVREMADACRLPVPLIQAVVGPRQVGKTTAAEQLVQRLKWPSVFAAADAPLPPGPEWIETQWQRARALKARPGQRVLLVLDEIQKVRGWSESLKRLWDEERRSGATILPIVLGSSALLVQHGLTESLAGRFLLHRCTHWTWDECRKAFGWDLDQWLYFGGYPGAAPLINDEVQWKRYVSDSLIETVLARDVLQMQPITKPTLLRHLFALAATLPAQMVSYTKMLGQLQDAGNTTTLANYVRLLETAFLLSGLEAYSRGKQRKRGSSPKLVLWNNALINAVSPHSFTAARADGGWWGRLVENAVGAHLVSSLREPVWGVTYWRSGAAEVDFVVSRGATAWAIEVKSGRSGRTSGLAAFQREYPRAKSLLVGAEGIPLKEFFAAPAEAWFA